MAKPRVKAPKSASKGEIIEIKTLISHKMESGQRKDKSGNVIPRMIINKFTAKFNGKDVFSMDVLPAIAANPFIQFTMKAEESGEFEFTWVDDSNEVSTKKSALTVS